VGGGGGGGGRTTVAAERRSWRKSISSEKWSFISSSVGEAKISSKPRGVAESGSTGCRLGSKTSGGLTGCKLGTAVDLSSIQLETGVSSEGVTWCMGLWVVAGGMGPPARAVAIRSLVGLSMGSAEKVAA